MNESKNIPSTKKKEKQFKTAGSKTRILASKNSHDVFGLEPSDKEVSSKSKIARLDKSNDVSPSERGKALCFPQRSVTIGWLAILSLWAFVLRLGCCEDFLQYAVAFPFIGYWAYWLFCIDYACGLRYECHPPVKASTVMLLCLCNFIFFPLVGNLYFQPLIDPFFYVWLFSLAYIPFRIGMFLEQKENSNKKTLAYVLTGGSIGLLVLAVSLPGLATITPALVLGLAWFLSQFSWITYIVKKLFGEFDVTSELTKIRRTEVHVGTNIVLRYRAFPEIERWFAQKFNAERMLKGRSALFMWFGGPPLIFISIIGLSAALPGLEPVRSTVAAVPTASAAANANVALFFIYALAALVFAVPAGLLIKPTHLYLGEKGLGFLWHRRFFKFDSTPMSWKMLRNIYIQHPVGQSSASFDKLCFEDEQNRVTRIRLNCLDSFEDKELLLNAIRTWAPKVSKDASVIESLQPPSGYSYTELWLQALSAPPKRDRFKPLVHDAFLKNNRYRVLGSLGSGGQGFAYLTEDCSKHLEVVLKEFILPVYVDVRVRKSALEQFENEARMLSRLRHPQIVNLLDYFVEDHRAYLVLEHIEGASLKNIVDHNGPLKEKEIVTLALQMCDVLSYLHSQAPPVVHRDFTPDNLLLGTDGILKLIDFNVAESTESTTTGTVVGKPAYLPPEQFRGVPTSQSDIYAMGATLYFLLTGLEPQPISVSHPAEVKHNIDPLLDQIISRATQLETGERYSSIIELRQALEQLHIDGL